LSAASIRTKWANGAPWFSTGKRRSAPFPISIPPKASPKIKNIRKKVCLLMVKISLLYQIQSGYFFQACQRLFVIGNLHVEIKFSVDYRLKVADHV
jgi:hypothetical protein